MPTISTLTVDVKANTSKMSSGLKSAGIAIAGLAAGAAVAFNQFQESEKVGAQTAAVLKSTGEAAHVSAQQIEDMATALSNKTGIDDEAIQSGENLLLTFTNIRNEAGKGNDIFNQATQTITDMSVALGQDMKSSSIQLGKALNDPIKGITALRRVGVAFTDQQTKQITKMQKSGDILGAQKIILAELTKEFGGSAEAQATDAAKAGVAFGNLEEALGGVVSAGLGPLLTAVQPVIAFLTKFPGLTAAVVVGITAVYVATKLYVLWQERAIIVQKLLALTNPFTLIATAAVLLAFLIVKNWATIKRVVLGVWNAIRDSAPFKIIATIVKTYIRVIIVEIKAVLAVARAVWTAVRVTAVAAFNVIAGAFKLEIGAIRLIFNTFKGAIITGWHAIRDVGKGIWAGISSAARAVFNAIASAWNSTVGRLSFHIPSWVPGIGGNGWDVPDIPMLAQGGLVLRTGLALVHEGERFSGVGGGWGNITINVAGSVVTERELVDQVQKGLLKVKRRSGPLGLA